MSIFKFKQFDVIQQNSSAKVGTDGVLLGAWATLENNPKTILDIGAGTGLISLMLAQRTEKAKIYAIEKDKLAYEECKLNFENSPWNQRLKTILGDITLTVFKEKFDLIVSNPPFYQEDYASKDSRRASARHTVDLSFENLFLAINKCISSNGVLCVIIPFKERELLVNLGENIGLFPFKELHIKGNPNADVKRILMAFSHNNVSTEIFYLTIENIRHNYTNEYINLTKDFYLKM